jgi:7-carboxy-7-deazaguanine synthase
MNNRSTDQPKTTLEGATLPLMEHFYTLQGEGHHAGSAAYFLRLGGCDVGCRWCDVKESWDGSKHPMVAVDQMVDWINASGAMHVVITGGEPTMHPLGALITALRAAGKAVWMETAGTSPMTMKPDWVCLSPKKFKAPRAEWLEAADEFKLVVFHPSDLEWAQQFLPHLPVHCKKFVQPEWEKREQILPLLIEWVKSHPDWRLSLQTHKYLDIP